MTVISLALLHYCVVVILILQWCIGKDSQQMDIKLGSDALKVEDFVYLGGIISALSSLTKTL